MNIVKIKKFYICTLFKSDNRTIRLHRSILNLKNVIVFCTLLLSVSTYAQRYELGVQLGTTNLVGDIGKTNYIFPSIPSVQGGNTYNIPFYANLLFRLNFNPYQTLRFNLGYNQFSFRDTDAIELYRYKRKISGNNDFYETSVMFEYNMFPANNEQKDPLLSPYIFAGVGAMLYNGADLNIYHDFNRNVAGIAQVPTTSTDFNTTATLSYSRKITGFIPFGVGLKYKFHYNWAIFGEFLFRATFTDGLDYSSFDSKNTKVTYNKDILNPTNSKQSLLQSGSYAAVAATREQYYKDQANIGNPNSKDWANTISIGISYSFGRPPCNCDHY